MNSAPVALQVFTIVGIALAVVVTRVLFGESPMGRPTPCMLLGERWPYVFQLRHRSCGRRVAVSGVLLNAPTRR